MTSEGIDRSETGGKAQLPLLSSKFQVPLPRDLVERPRLTERLEQNTGLKLTLVSAPAGFGKTSLISIWIQENQRSYAYLTLDRGHNDSACFLHYLAAAFQKMDATIGERVAGPMTAPQTSLQMALSHLINAATDYSESFALILEDYHSIDSASIHEALAFLLDNMPANMHLVVTTRADPPLPLPRLRVRGQLHEIRAADLRFTEEESQRFLNGIMGLAISEPQIGALNQRTEGWIAGLQLSALSLRNHADPAGFIRDLTGDDHYIMDFLVDEVLQKQSETVQTFLLQTSFLERLSGPLCDAVTCREDSQELLEQLEEQNLFVFPLDTQRQGYRYHRLFADVLQARLKRRLPRDISTMKSRAIQWFESQSCLEDAIWLSLDAQFWDDSRRLLSRIVESRDWDLRAESVVTWLRTLPREVLAKDAVCCLGYARLLLWKGDLAECRRHLEIAERNLTESGRESQLGPVWSVKALLSPLRGEPEAALTLAKKALQVLPADDAEERAMVNAAIAHAHLARGEVGQALLVLPRTMGAKSTITRAFALIVLSQALVESARLRQAEKISQQIIEKVSDTLPRGPVAARTCLAAIHLEWNDLQAADRELSLAFQTAQERIYRLAVPHAYYVLSRLRWAQGNADAAFEALGAAEAAGRQYRPDFLSETTARRGHFWLIQGKLDQVAEWIREQDLKAEGEIVFQQEAGLVVLSRFLLASGDVRTALGLTERLLEAARPSGRVRTVLTLSAFRALLFDRVHDQSAAFVSLKQALSAGRPEGFVNAFLEEGPAMARLLSRLLAEDRTLRSESGRDLREYVEKLLSAFGTPTPDEKGTLPASPKVPESYLLDPLSARELDVLKLIAAGFSNIEIANQLFVAKSTVKTHINRIYAKLDARSRTRALLRAKEWQILDSNDA